MIDLRKKETAKSALDKYEEAHKTWFNTPVFSDCFPELEKKLRIARENYVEVYKRENPESIVF